MVYVSNYLEHHSPSVVWSLVFVHAAFPKDDYVGHLFSFLGWVHLNDSLHNIVQNLNATRKFTVKSYFLHLSSLMDSTPPSLVVVSLGIL